MPSFTTSDSIALHHTDEGEGTPLLRLAARTRDGRDFDFVAPGPRSGMRRRGPDTIGAEMPDRGHIPYLDEAESLATLREWMKRL